MNSYTVCYFAAFREQAGCAEETVDAAAGTAAELFDEVRERHPDLQPFRHMKFAVNDELVAGDTPLKGGDRILFFPPVAGG